MWKKAAAPDGCPLSLSDESLSLSGLIRRSICRPFWFLLTPQVAPSIASHSSARVLGFIAPFVPSSPLFLIRSFRLFLLPAMRNRCNLHAYAYRKIKLIPDPWADWSLDATAIAINCFYFLHWESKCPKGLELRADEKFVNKIRNIKTSLWKRP